MVQHSQLAMIASSILDSPAFCSSQHYHDSSLLQEYKRQSSLKLNLSLKMYVIAY